MNFDALTQKQAWEIYARDIRRLHRESPQSFAWIYGIQVGDWGPVKIGLTEGHPRDRLKQLQQGSYLELKGIGAWRDLKLREKQLHEEFDYARIRGEWFQPVPELVETIVDEGCTFCDWTPLTKAERVEFGLA